MKTIRQIAQNIWKVSQKAAPELERTSLFITEPTQAFEANAAFACDVDAQGYAHFSLDGIEVLAEIEPMYTQGFSISEKDAVYGLGVHQHKPLNRRGQVFQMVQKNGSVIAVPFLTSTAGYALLFDTCAYMSIGIDKPCTKEYAETYEPEESILNQIQIYADDAEDVFEYYVILGRSIKEQIAGYRALTGKSPMFAKWTYGFFQSREHYKTRAELLENAHGFRDRHIPLDCIVQDWNYWGDLGWNAMEWDEKVYPDPDGMVNEIHDMDMKIMLSAWPSFGPQTNICKELEAVGGILEKPERNGENWGRVHDPLNPAVADVLWKYIKNNLLSKGIDAWWLDSTEPAFESDCSLHLLQCTPCYLGNNARYLNQYAFSVGRNLYQRLRKESSDKRIFILTRSGYAGQQAYATTSWTGDVKASWASFKEQIPSVLSSMVSGVPYCTTDIGGFFVDDYEGGNQNPQYRELYTRWFWFGAFSPIFRSHGTSTPREMWHFGKPSDIYYDAQLKADRLRYELMPYIYAQAFRVYDEDESFVHPLAMDFPEDENVLNISDSYMFGDALLVHIVTDPDVKKTQVYLPKGAEWVEYFTGKRYAGGQTVMVDAPLDQTPLFVKGGSIIVTTEPAECTAWQDEKILRLNLCTGANVKAFYYLDAQDGYDYEKGCYVKIPFDWSEENRNLTIGVAQGRSDLFDVNRTFEIYVDGKKKTIATYTGEAIRLNF